MNAFRFLPIVTLLFLSLTVGSVYANGYSADVPLLGTTGAPALGAPSLFSGLINVLYADGRPVVLSTDNVILEICAGNYTAGNYTQGVTPSNQQQRNGTSSGCFTAEAHLKQTAPGTYTYSFTPPSLSGVVTIYIRAGTLADDNGKIFPAVDTSIGTYASPSTSSSSVPAMAAPAGTPPSQIKQAVNMSPSVAPTGQSHNVTPTNQSPVITVVAALTILAVLGCLFIFLPRKR